MFASINVWIGAAAGAALIGVLGLTYNALVDNPSVRRETTAVVEAKARERTVDAINEVTDAAQRARAMRRYCVDGGELYNLVTGKCWNPGLREDD